MISIRDWLADTADLPRLECELLLEFRLGLSRASVIAYSEKQIDPAELVQDIAKLRRKIPLAYILGEREFWGLAFKVTPDVLVPRPETELLVELAIKHAPAQGRVLDLGTGSGAIAIALAHERTDLTVTACDLSEAALDVAKQNAATHNSGVKFVQSNWCLAFTARPTWHVIVANPPYIAANDPHLPDLHAEPQGALVSPDEGLADIKQIAQQCRSRLLDSGTLMIEHGYNQAQQVREIFQANGYQDVVSVQDLAKIERVTLGHRS